MPSSDIDTVTAATQVTLIDYSTITNLEDLPSNQQALRHSAYPELISQAAPPTVSTQDWDGLSRLVNRDYLGPFQVPVDKLEFTDRWYKRTHSSEQILALRDEIKSRDLRGAYPILVELYPTVISPNDLAMARSVTYTQLPPRFVSAKGAIGSVIMGFKRVQAAKLLAPEQQFVFVRFLLPGQFQSLSYTLLTYISVEQCSTYEGNLISYAFYENAQLFHTPYSVMHTIGGLVTHYNKLSTILTLPKEEQSITFAAWSEEATEYCKYAIDGATPQLLRGIRALVSRPYLNDIFHRLKLSPAWIRGLTVTLVRELGKVDPFVSCMSLVYFNCYLNLS